MSEVAVMVMNVSSGLHLREWWCQMELLKNVPEEWMEASGIHRREMYVDEMKEVNQT